MRVVRTTTVIALLASLGLTACAGEQDLSATAPLTAETDESAEPVQGAPSPTRTPDAAAVAEPYNDGSGCVLSPEQVQQALAQWAPPGSVSVYKEYSTDYGGCAYKISEGTFPQANGSNITLRNAGDYITFTADRFRYVDAKYSDSGVYDTTRRFGGSSATEVYETAYAAARDVGAAAGETHPPQQYPDIGSGLVLEDSGISFTLAGSNEHWYRGGLSGLAGDPIYTDAVVELATLIAQNE